MTEKKRKQKMFISVLPGEQVEVVLTEEGVVQDYYVEMHHQEKTRGNIYKGFIHNIDPALQAAFINYGAERNGFLQIDEIHPEYYQGSYTLNKGQKYPAIQKVLKPGQELLVQVGKEPTGKKGAFLSSYLSLPGRGLVLTPGNDTVGVSRKIEGEDDRKRLKDIVEHLGVEEGIGLIVRTAGVSLSKASLTNDYKYLMRLWKEIRQKGLEGKAPSIVYQEMDLAARAVRDYLSADIAEIWVDDPETADQVQKYVKLAYPRRRGLVKLHKDEDKGLLARFNLRRQIDQVFSREVLLPSGGRLVFDQTEALMAVDINSGKIGGKKSFKEMALKTNLEAAEEIARQLRLRDYGGQVVIDFIELKEKKHIAEVEKRLKQCVKSDRARTDVGRMSRFGLLEMVRQRLGSSAISVSTEPCPICQGTGVRRNMEWRALQLIKDIHRQLRKAGGPNPLVVETDLELALYMLNNKRGRLLEIEEKFEKTVVVAPEKH
ncbi:MAG: ribonuclease [Desulfovibrionales bacterium]|jgi:ribonuclease E|nr:ribonuclease [Desulfovibrionales bacterium]